MMDLGAALGRLDQAQSALDLTEAARSFRHTPGVMSGLRLIDTVTGIVGVERLSAQLAKYVVKMALKGDDASLRAAQEMVDLMRARVPQDTGRLLNGIGYRREGGLFVVEATAERNGFDYALAVEAGHHAGGVHADAALFADTTGRGGRQRAVPHESDVSAQPFFYSSVREALADWKEALREGVSEASREADL